MASVTRALAVIRRAGRRPAKLLLRLTPDLLRLRLMWSYLRHGIRGVDRALTSEWWRIRDILAWYGAQVGQDCIIHGPLYLFNAHEDYSNLRIGHRVHIGPRVFLDLAAAITIGDEAVISMNSVILTHQDVGDRVLRTRYPRRTGAVEIGRGAYLGANVIVLPGCSIGAYSAVGAGSLVTKELPENVTALGSPAAIVKEFAEPPASGPPQA